MNFNYFIIYRFIGGLGGTIWITKFNTNFIWNEKNELLFYLVFLGLFLDFYY